MNLFIFGLGYSVTHFIQRYRNEFVSISGTVRSADKAAQFAADGIKTYVWDGSGKNDSIATALADVDDIIVSIPPGPDGDPVAHAFGEAIDTAPLLRTIVYLSTVGVYGDHQGEWVSEDAPAQPHNDRSRHRLRAEREWTALAGASGLNLHILRLAGIYGPGRNAFENLRKGRAKRVIKPGQVFNRIHVEDIARTITACLDRTTRGELRVWNVADNEPAPPQDVVTFAADMIGVDPPPEVAFEDADMTPMARSFYSDNKRISNRALREELGVTLACPTYREGLSDIATREGIGRGQVQPS
ncbi:MAG: SDR family oxidoreductase [Hyphomicrobiales bacterium]|nr:SDR family oxidoreductase [Hyphomicrobiales bacterium]